MNGTTFQPDDSTEDAAKEGAGDGQKLGIAMLLLLIAGTSVLAYRLYPEEHRQSVSPSFIDNIFASNLVIFIARVMLLLGAGVLAAGMFFVVLSIWKRAKAGHYLTRFGPFETQAIEDIRGEVETWQAYWAEENQEVTELNERIEDSDALIAKLQDELREANAAIEKWRKEGSS